MAIIDLLIGKAPLNKGPETNIKFLIKDGSVTTQKISDKAVTKEKLAQETIDYFRDLVVGMLNADQNAIANLSYYECNTLGATKVKSIDSRYYRQIEGGAMQIKMAHANTFDGNVQLKIEDEPVKLLYYNGLIANATNTWQDDETIVVYYDGQVYQGYNYVSLITDHINSLRTEISERIDTILGTGDQTDAIDTFGEMIAFLDGITNENTLQQLLTTINERIDTTDSNVTTVDNRVTTITGQLSGQISTLAGNISNFRSTLLSNINRVDNKVTEVLEDLATANDNISDLDDRIDALEGTIDTGEEDGTLQERVNNLEDQLDNKVDKEEGKSLIDEDYAEDVYYDDSLQYMKVITDADGAILWAITKTGDIKYGYGIPSDIKNYIDSQLTAEVERAQAAEQLMLENRILEVYELPDASEETLDHVYILKNNKQDIEDSADKWVTVTCDVIVKYVGAGMPDIEQPVIFTSKEVTGWYNAEYENPSDGDIFLNPEWVGEIRSGRPLPEIKRTRAYVYNATSQEYENSAAVDFNIELGEVYYNDEDEHFYVASIKGWKKYDRSENLTLEEDIAEGNVEEGTGIHTGYKWERVSSSTICPKQINIGENTSIYEEEGITHIKNLEKSILLKGNVVADSFTTESLTVGAGITVDGIDLIPQQNIQVIATGQSMNYQVTSLASGERINIFFTHHPDDVGNAQHTVNVTAGGKTLTCTFQASSYCEVCVTRVNNTYFLREIPAGI